VRHVNRRGILTPFGGGDRCPKIDFPHHDRTTAQALGFMASRLGNPRMLVVEMVAKIRRDYLVEGKSIKAIARYRGISRDTVRKVLRSGVVGAGTAKQLQSLLSQIIKRIMKALTRHGAFIG
jgi:hypothetical protein